MLIDFLYQKPSQKCFKKLFKNDKKAMRNKITQKSATKTPQSSPKAAPGPPNGSVRHLLLCRFRTQDRSKILLGRSWAPFPLPMPFLEPLGHLRDAPGAIQERFSDPPGPPKDPPETNFQQLQPALKKRLTCIPRYRNLCKNTIKHIKIQDTFGHLLQARGRWLRSAATILSGSAE